MNENVKKYVDPRRVNPYPAKVTYLNFQPLEAVSRCRDPQLQVAENYLYLVKLGTNIVKSGCLNTHFDPNNSDVAE